MTQVTETGTVLDRIIAQTAQDLTTRRALIPRSHLQSQLAAAPPAVDVISALTRDTVTVIAEVKRASPSKGRFPVEIDPASVARAYATGGAAMISCLTDGPFFQGSIEDLDAVVGVAGVASPPVGVLRKDFIIDEYQIDEARVHGASCVLLIAACLNDETLRRLHDYASSLGMAILVEIHDRTELERAMALDPSLLGINNRSLKTLSFNLAVTESLAPLVPPGIVLAGESGIFTAEDVERMAAVGVDAVLVGESLIVQSDRVAAVRSLQNVRKSPRG
jgi:indole-3-glycerol phosphate synthase